MVVGCNKTENINTLPTGEKGKVVNVVETKATLPKFTVGTMGLYDGGFNNESIKDAKVYEDVLLKLQNQTGVAIEELVTLCTTYYGDENKYRAFAVGVTNPLSDNNFPLTYNDEGTGEVTAFWIRTKDFTVVGLPDTIVLEW